MKILMTGASGFIGRNIIKPLLQNNYHVLAPVRNDSAILEQPGFANFHPAKGIFYQEEMIGVYRNFNPDIILHLAALRGEGQGSAEKYQKVNVLGTKKLVQFALDQKVKLFIYFSTVGVYGTIPIQLPAGLQTEFNPDSLYHRSKLQGETLVRDELTHKIPYIIIRPTITYGPGDNGFLSKLIRLVGKKRFPLIRKNVWVHLLNVETLCNFISLDLMNPELHDKVFIFADHSPVKLNDLVDAIYSYFHKRSYPAMLKVPAFFYTAGQSISTALRLTDLKISFKLLSNSWYYDVHDIERFLPIQLDDTLTGVKKYLEQNFPNEVEHSKK